MASTIRGKLVSAETRKPVAGLRVEAWSADARHKAPLGTAASDKDGAFAIGVSPGGQDVFLRVFHGDALVMKSEQPWNEKAPEKSVTLAVPNGGALPINPAAVAFTASGQVTTELGVAASDLRVEVWDRNVDGATLLQAGTTDATGRYTIAYDPALLRGKARGDLEIRVIDPRANAAELGRSPVAYQADPVSVHDMVVTGARIARVPEYDRLQAQMRPLLGTRPLLQLDADGVTYVAERGGWDARAVAMTALAAQYTGKTKIPTAHYYALLRSGLPSDLNALHRVPDARIQQALEQAVASGVIGTESPIAGTVKLHHAYATQVLKDTKAAGAASTLGDMLSLHLTADQQTRFLEVYRALGDDPDSLWTRLAKADFDPRTVAALRTDAALGRLTLQNAPVVKRLADASKIASLGDLALAGMHTPDKWKDAIGGDVPAGLTAESYAAGLAAQVRLAEPTLVAADLVRSGKVKVDAGDEVAKFLIAGNADTTLGTDPVRMWKGYDALSDAGKAGARAVERLYQVSPSNESMIALSGLGFGSAREIAAGYTRESFSAKFGGKLPSGETELIYRKATQVHTTALSIATMYLAQRAAPNLYGLSGSTTKQPVTPPPDVVAAGTLEDLFKDMDYCACDECRSVFGAAAYLVELLEFIDLADVPHTGANPLEVLLARRPDLQHILLSCENTNTALPYVDIVNEVLEYYVVNGSLAAYTGHDMTPETQTADLLADPQFVIDAAYDATAAAVYPSSLPFELPLASLRLLFEVWDTTLADALSIFGDAAGSRRERLALNHAEYSILTDVAFRKLPEYFGEPAGDTIGQLNDAIANAKTFCRRIDITYEELAEILGARFVNPGIGLVPALEALETDLSVIQQWYTGALSDAQLRLHLPAELDPAPYGGDPLPWLTANRTLIMGLITLTDMSPEPVETDMADVELRFALPDPANNRLTDIAYHRLHRFIRLWRKLGRSVALTDELMTAFLDGAPQDLTIATIDAAFVTLLARLGNFQRLLDELAISEGKVADWVTLLDATIPADTRRDFLAGLLRAGTADAATLSALTGIDPLAADMDADEPSLLRFARAWREVKASPLKVADLDFVLRNADPAGKLIPPAAEQLSDVKALRDALTQVDADLGAGAAPDLGAARAKLALVYDAPVVDRLLALIGDTTTYSAPFVTAEETLPASLTGVELDPFAKRLTFAGALSAAQQAALDAAADALALTDFTELTTQAEVDAFVADFKAAVQALRDAAGADAQAFFADYPELQAVYDAAAALTDPAAQAAAIVAAILPELRELLKTTALGTALTAITKADATVVDALTAVLGSLPDFRALETVGAFAADGDFQLLLDPPATTDYIVYVDAPPGSTVTLAVGGAEVIPTSLVDAGGELSTTVELTLAAGALTTAELTLDGLPAGATATLLWRSRGMTKTAIPASRIYESARVETARRSLLRLRKAALLQGALGLTAAEVTAFGAPLAGLDVDGTIADPAVHALWAQLEPLLWFAQLKAAHEDEPDTLLAALGDAAALAGVMEWDPASLAAVLGHFGVALGGLDALRRVVPAMDLADTTLQPAADLIAWATAAPDLPLIDGIKATLRSRMTDASYRESIQSVNDALRNARRDALVAWILFHHPPEPDIATADELYEHFLVDVQMDACMQTSRIVLALSTVQLFITRCLMNLEANVSADSIDADQWEWMQRYRVWEANRRVFVYPENWLEPELRDGKSSFFSELESELLKSDITDDLAEEAYLSYLKKLDDVAKLQLVAGYQDGDVLHVFGRTNGKTRKYYSRRFEFGYWTPWEEITLQIEGELLVPVVWRSQLFLLWVTEVTKPDKGNRAETAKAMGDDQWGTKAKLNTEVTINWGEYYNGKWTSPKSSEMKDPLRITGLDEYDPTLLVMTARTEQPNPDFSERLVLSLVYMGNGDSFLVTFTSKHSAPLVDVEYNSLQAYADPIKVFNWHLFMEGQDASVLDSNSLDLFDKTLEVAIRQPSGALLTTVSERLLTKSAALLSGFNVRPIMQPVDDQWESPFFYADEHSVFLVAGDETVYDPPTYTHFYPVGDLSQVDVSKIPPLYETPSRPVIINPGDPVIDPVQELINANYRAVISDNSPFVFGGAVFNAQGRAGQVRMP